jgi:hypothetical protein
MSDLSRTNDRSVGEPKTNQSFVITDIPFILFQELARTAGIGEKFTAKISGNNWEAIKLNPNHRAVGYNAAIGYRKIGDHTAFVLWNTIPTPENADTVFEPRAVIKFIAGSQETGTWMYGQGNRMEEKVIAEFDIYGLNLKFPGAALAALILMRATMLTKDPKCIAKSFWEADIHPGGDFTSPD